MLKELEEIREVNQEDGIRMSLQFLIPGQESRGTYITYARFNPAMLGDPTALGNFIGQVLLVEAARQANKEPEDAR